MHYLTVTDWNLSGRPTSHHSVDDDGCIFNQTKRHKLTTASVFFKLNWRWSRWEGRTTSCRITTLSLSLSLRCVTGEQSLPITASCRIRWDFYPWDGIWIGSCSSFEPATSRQHLIKLVQVSEKLFLLLHCLETSYNVHLKHYTRVTVGQFKKCFFLMVSSLFLFVSWCLSELLTSLKMKAWPQGFLKNKSEWMKNLMHDVLSKINLPINVNSWIKENSLLAS